MGHQVVILAATVVVHLQPLRHPEASDIDLE